MTEKEVELRAIAGALLNAEGQEEVDEMLDNSDLAGAEAYVLGGVDRCFTDGAIDFNEAKGYYERLGVDPERASQLRQNHGKDPSH